MASMLLPIDTNIFPHKEGVYVVGGSIRDLLCGRAPIDYDVVVADDPDRFAQSLAARTSGHVVEFGKPGYTIRRVITKEVLFDIMPINGASIEEDLLRRDFTINAMAFEVSSARLIDLTGGRRDLSDRVVRMVARNSFQKDPVRLIRAYRMAAALDFSIDADTESAICQDAKLICKSAGERTREELFKILNCAESYVQLYRMADSGLLFALFPELLRLRNYWRPENRSATFFEQTLNCYVHLEKLLQSPDQLRPTSVNRHAEFFDSARIILLKLAVLFQDIGKPATATVMAADSAPFSSHAAQSAELAESICRGLKFSKRQLDSVETIIRHHLKPFLIFADRPQTILRNRAFVRLFMTCGDHTPAILLHALANFMGRKPQQAKSIRRFAKFIDEGLKAYYAELKPRSALPPLLNGHDLKKEFGLAPSAIFKQILKYIEQERLARTNLTRKRALELVKELLIRKRING